MHSAPCLLLAALLLAARALPAAAAAPVAPDGDLLTAGLGINVCEAYTSRKECLEHPDTCIPCSAWGKVDVCFETAIAKRLPTSERAPPPATSRPLFRGEQQQELLALPWGRLLTGECAEQCQAAHRNTHFLSCCDCCRAVYL